MKPDRRQFLVKSGTTLGLSVASPGVLSLVDALAAPGAPSNQKPTDVGASALPHEKRPLYNTNLQTAVGLGDEPPGFLDNIGQLKTRNAEVQVEIGLASPRSGQSRVLAVAPGWIPADRDFGGPYLARLPALGHIHLASG